MYLALSLAIKFASLLDGIGGLFFLFFIFSLFLCIGGKEGIRCVMYTSQIEFM